MEKKIDKSAKYHILSNRDTFWKIWAFILFIKAFF